MRLMLPVLVLLATSSLVFASEIWEYEVAVPVYNDDSDTIHVLHVVHRLPISGEPASLPGSEIRLGCEPAFIQAEGGAMYSTVGGDGHPFDVNVASLLKFKVEVEERRPIRWRFIPSRIPDGSGIESDPSGHPGHYVVDSLRVRLDVSALEADSTRMTRADLESDPASREGAVAATVAAILDNARRSSPSVSSILLEVVGSTRYRRFSKLYRITSQYPRAFAGP